MKPDLKITLVFDVVEDHSKQSDDLALIRYFNYRLINFFNLHPEVTFFDLGVLLLLIVFYVFEGAIYTILTSASRALFKHSKFSNYIFKMSKFSISNALYYTNFHKRLPFKVLNQCPEGTS